MLLLSFGPIAPDGITLLIEKERLCLLFLLICIDDRCAAFVAVAVVFIVTLFVPVGEVFGGEN